MYTDIDKNNTQDNKVKKKDDKKISSNKETVVSNDDKEKNDTFIKDFKYHLQLPLYC